MQLQALRYFLTVASTRSFLATARQFQVPASSVSRFIGALEKELGQQLFYRSTRAVRLTEAGEQFHLQVRDAVEMLDQAADEMARQDAAVHGLIRLNAPEAFGRLHVVPIVNALQARYPDLVVELTLTDAYVDPVQDGNDITLRVGPVVDSGLVGRVLASHRHLLVASPQYLKQHGKPKRPEDLLNHRCLVYKGQLGAQKWYFRRTAKGPVEALQVSGPLRSNNAEALLAAAIAGRGLVLFPTWLFNAETLQRKQLVPLLQHWEWASQAEPVYLQMLSPENKLRSRKVREVSRFLVEAIGSPPYWEAVADGGQPASP